MSRQTFQSHPFRFLGGGRISSVPPGWKVQHAVPPHPCPLPQGGGGPFPESDNTVSAGFLSARPTILPLPEGEGWGEGEEGARPRINWWYRQNAPLGWSTALASLALLLVNAYAAGTHPIANSTNCLVHPSLEISLFAAEPDVVDPVALTFDAAGRMYVVEMRDYPYGFGPQRKPGGTIRLLEDTNHDGKVDRSTVFAENLSFPTSICAWNGGVLVASPPELIFLKATDGDGRADVREVMFKGFTLGVTDSNFNGLRWGLDNRVHGLNGGNGGRVTSLRKPEM